MAASCVLGLLACSGTASAQIVNVTPNIADDIGNWETTTVDELQIRRNGFTGYYTAGLFADLGGKTTHPQHIVRLPNAIGPDGQAHAYFAISHSADWGSCPSNPGGILADISCGGDGFWMVAQIDEEDYDEVADLIITNGARAGDSLKRQVTEGQYVFEEHFTTDVPLVSPNCSPTPCLKDGKIWYSGAGDWNHPAAMATMGDALLMVGQQFDGSGTITMGRDADALLFYDVSQPWAPVYQGKLNVCQLGMASDCDGLLLQGRNVLSGLGLAYFENGWYHLSLGGGPGVVANFYCDAGADCFIAPVTVGPAGKWKDLPPVGTEKQSGGQQGQVIHTREIYSSAPIPGEPCYKPDGTLLAATDAHVMCSPPGVQRAIYSRAVSDPPDTYSVEGRCWPYTICGTDTYLSPLLSTYRNDAGVAFFDFKGGYARNDGTGSVLSPGPDALMFDGGAGGVGGYAQGRGGPGTPEFSMTQLTGECGPNNGTHVDNNGNVIIYCVSESVNEPIDCYSGAGESDCNRIFANRANGALRYGVIRFIEPGGRDIVYRGRGLPDTEYLNKPPWGPGRNDDGTLMDPSAVDWTLALTTPGTVVQVLSGQWSYFSATNFGGPESYRLNQLVPPNGYVIGARADDGTTNPVLRSIRPMQEYGIALFDGEFETGRMISAVRSVPNLVRYCGEYDICEGLNPLGPDSDGTCDVLESRLGTQVACTWPRTFWGKASSSEVKSSSWVIYGDENFNPAFQGTIWTGTSRGTWGSFSEGRSIRRLPVGVCIAPAKPVEVFETSFPFGDSRPLFTITRVAGGGPFNNANRYQVMVEQLDGAVMLNERRWAPPPAAFGGGELPYRSSEYKYMPAENVLTVGETYKWRIRGIDAQNDCYEEGSWSDYQFVTILGPAVEVSLTPVTNDPLGLGTGTIEFAPGSATPASDIGSNYYPSGSIVILLATPAPDSEFVSWAGGAASCGTQTTCELTVTANLNVEAMFRPKPRLFYSPQGSGTVTVNPTGIDCSNGSGWVCEAYPTGTAVTMTAAITPGQSTFRGWTGDADCTDNDDNDGNPLTSRVTLTTNRTGCTAVFDRSNYLLEVTTATSGGSVSGTDDIPGVLTCDTEGQVCSKTYAANSGRIATLTATADQDFRFVRWNGSEECWSNANGNGKNNPINVTVGVTDDIYCRAVFVDINGVYTLDVQKTGAGSGASTVTAVIMSPTPGNLPGINCPLPDCTTEVPSIATIRLTAKPVRGARFDGWFGSDPLCELPPIQVPDPDNFPFTMDSPDPNPVISVDMTEAAALGGDLSCRANFSANILLIDGSTDASTTGPRVDYGQVFNTLPDIDFDVWSVRSPGSGGGVINQVRTEPTAEDLAPYSRVIWFTADASADNPLPLAAGPSPTAEAALGQYLDGGGCLLLSSPEYFDDRGLTAFAQSYFGISAFAGNFGAATAVRGRGLLPGFNGLGRSVLDYGTATGASLNAALSDAVIANSDPATYSLLEYDNGSLAGVGRDNGVYRSAFLGFPFLALPSGTARSEAMGAFLDFCLQIKKDDWIWSQYHSGQY